MGPQRTPRVVLVACAAWLALSAPVPAAPAAPDDFRETALRLDAALRAKDRDAIANTVAALSATGDPRAVRILVQLGVRDTADPVRSAVREGLASQVDGDWIAALTTALRSSDSDAAAILVIEALGAIDAEGTGAALVEALESVRSPVLVTALRAARKKSDRALVPACIDVLARSEREAGQVWAETRITLQVLTGERFLVAADWRKWFDSRSTDWSPSTRRNAEEGAKTSVFRPAEGEGLAHPRIFGQEVASKRVVFVIDTSSSMEKIDPSAGGEEGSSAGTGPTRLQRAQKELVAAVQELRPEVRFNIIAYSSNVHPWVPEKLAPAKPSAKRKALEFIGSLRPDGTTSTGDALLMAMLMPDVDTVILLSDGSPTIPGSGDLEEIPPILERIFDVNRFRKVTIHTLGFTGAKVSFMKAIAHGTGGTYAAIR